MALLLGGLHVTPAQARNAGLPDFTAIVEKSEPAVVNIRTTAKVSSRAGSGGAPGQDPYELFRHFFGPDFVPPGGRQGPQQGPRGRRAEPEERSVPRGVGSGFFISEDGHLLTNHHVVADATDIFVTLTDGREFKAKVVGSDQRTDVALLKIDAKGMATLPIGNAKTLKKGQWVLAIGSPFGLESTVTSGIISALGRETGDYLPFIQTDVAVNPGNSGGPLLNLEGQVVGINAQIVSRSGGFMGISLAIPIDEAMQVVDQLKASGRVTRGRIGVQIGEVSKDVAQAIGLPKAEGALVSGVEPDGPAEKGGILPGDVILKFDGKTITRMSDLPRLVGQTKPGSVSPVEVWRKGKTVKLNVTVTELKAERTAEAPAPKDKPATAQTEVLGMSVVPVAADAQKKLRIKGGVQVTSVSGPAATAGIAEGDIILAANDSDITSPEQFAKVIAGVDKSRPVGLMVRTGDQTRWVAVTPAK
ncbi:DegQ family serine endoprotease [Achromobacter panacis]|nr:DegQ family serine endoprotease [Zwartia panacis]MDN4016628.1 DegQ family serine endoprotease [Zwartia panacis]